MITIPQRSDLVPGGGQKSAHTNSDIVTGPQRPWAMLVVHYPRTVWKNSYAEHEVTGKTYNYRKKKNPVLS